MGSEKPSGSTGIKSLNSLSEADLSPVNMYETEDLENLIFATFEKPVGKTQDFTLYTGRKTCGAAGLFIRNVDPKSNLVGRIKPQDQLIKVNDKYVKNSEIDSVNHMLDDLSGTVKLIVQRKKQERKSAPPYDNDPNMNLSPKKKRQKDKTGSITAGQRVRQNMKTKTPEKNIDDLKDLRKMFEVLDLLKIEYNQEAISLKEMKEKAKEVIEEQSSGSGGYSNGTTGFAVMAKAKEDDMLKREKLKNLYSKVDACLRELGDEAISILDTKLTGRGVIPLLKQKTDILRKQEYYLLVAGESSAGKSSLLNLILGEDLLPHHVLNTTSTICELKFGKERKLVVHYNYGDDQLYKIPPRTFQLKTMEECGKSYQEQIAPFVNRRQENGDMEENYEKIEIFYQHELLQEGVVFIDTPGLGESDEMDRVLMNYLPNAFAFIYVIDVSRGGGVQRDMKRKMMEIVSRLKSSGGGTETFHLLAECSLFVCNKWDLVDEKEKDEVMRCLPIKLSNCWENANLHHQIVYISTIQARKVQQYGGVTTEFNGLLESIKKMVLKTINAKLYSHWKLLDFILHQLYQVTNTLKQRNVSNNQNSRRRINSTNIRIENVATDLHNVRLSVNERLSHYTGVLQKKLMEYIYSPDFSTTFCNWSNGTFPPIQSTWDSTKTNAEKAVQYKFEEMLIEWERKNQVYSEIHRLLIDEFLARLNIIKGELDRLEKELYTVEPQVTDENHKKGIPIAAKVFVGAISPLLVPVGVAGFILGMPVFGAFVVRKKVEEKRKLENYRSHPRDFFEDRSKRFLADLTEEDVLKYAQKQMEVTERVLSDYIIAIPKLIEADKKLVSQLLNEERSYEELSERYTPVIEKCIDLMENIIPDIGIELCPATVDECDLQWKMDGTSCLGEGKFSLVYRGELKNGGRDRRYDPNLSFNVAVKVFKKPFDQLNSMLYLYEKETIRYLKHENVLKFFGAGRVKASHSSNKYTFIFVTGLCKENLRNFIRKDDRKTPAKSSNAVNDAIQTFLEWAKQIADGLNYIHEKHLVHRHLKLENILVNEEGTIKISDIGVVGEFLETEESIIYLAPEVLESLANRTKEADIYSYSIALWEMWYGTKAFTELMPIDKVTFPEKIVEGYRPKMDKMTINIPAIHDVMDKCWATEIKNRYSAKQCSEIFDEMMTNTKSLSEEKDSKSEHFDSASD